MHRCRYSVIQNSKQERQQAKNSSNDKQKHLNSILNSKGNSLSLTFSLSSCVQMAKTTGTVLVMYTQATLSALFLAASGLRSPVNLHINSLVLFLWFLFSLRCHEHELYVFTSKGTPSAPSQPSTKPITLGSQSCQPRPSR